MRRSELALAVALAVLGTSGAAHAYCRTASCPGGVTGARCEPAQETDCGTPIAWERDCVGYWLQEDASSEVSLDVTKQLFEQAFANWEAASCNPGTPHINVIYGGTVACAAHEYNQDAKNANIIAYRDKEWPHTGGAATLALTTVTYNLDNGEIYDADMEINTAQQDFTVGDTGVGFDLASVIQHETGHFLGLSHSASNLATMYASYTPGSVELRTLDADDMAAICAVYPPGPPIATPCDIAPRHGFSGECAANQPQEVEDGCALAPGGSRDAWGGLALAGALAALAARRGRRRG